MLKVNYNEENMTYEVNENGIITILSQEVLMKLHETVDGQNIKDAMQYYCESEFDYTLTDEELDELFDPVDIGYVLEDNYSWRVKDFMEQEHNDIYSKYY